jgi:hypothetical protein
MNNELVVVGRALAPLELSTYTVEFVWRQANLDRLRATLDTEIEQTKQMRHKLVMVHPQMKEVFPEQDAELQRLHWELLELQGRKEDADRLRAAENETHEEAVARNAERLRQEVEQANMGRKNAAARDPKRAEKVKKVFRKIASHCAPGRTKDPELRKAYSVARSFYEELDLETLEQILKGVMEHVTAKKYPKSLRKLIEAQKERVSNALLEVFAQQRQIRSTEGWRVVHLMDTGQTREAQSMYLALMERRRDELLALIDLERNKPRWDTVSTGATYVHDTRGQ